MTEIVAGYRVRGLDYGTTELVEPGPSWSVGAIGAIWGGIGVLAILTPSGWEAGPLTPFLLLIFFVFPGGHLFLQLLRPLLVQQSWLVRGGEIARRRRIRAFGLTRDGRFAAVRQVEIRHGVWKTRGRSTDIARFYVYDRERPIPLAWRHARTSEIDAEILALARLVGSRVGRKVDVLTETIKAPSND